MYEIPKKIINRLYLIPRKMYLFARISSNSYEIFAMKYNRYKRRGRQEKQTQFPVTMTREMKNSTIEVNCGEEEN